MSRRVIDQSDVCSLVQILSCIIGLNVLVIDIVTVERESIGQTVLLDLLSDIHQPRRISKRLIVPSAKSRQVWITGTAAIMWVFLHVF